MPSGFLLIDKPAGITSHDVIDRLRKITSIKKIGHAGTLDPFATGLLIVAVQREATKQISNFVKLGKTYAADFVLGATSETLDPESEVIIDPDFTPLSESEIEKAIKILTGDISQVPPMYAAIKIKGKKLYELARAGKTVEVEPRQITISKFKLIGKLITNTQTQIIPVEVSCSSGTYIRALARDLGAILGTSGYVKVLRRTLIDKYSVENAVKLQNLTPLNWTDYLFSANLSV